MFDFVPKSVLINLSSVFRMLLPDYTTPQTIKFYNKGIEKLSGEAFNGTLLFTWLIKVQDKALQFAWIPILTIEGKLLTPNFAEISFS